MRVTILILAVGIGLAGILSSVEAQALDCRNARQATEQTICDNSELLDLDDEMEKYYDELLDIAPARELRQIENEHRAFLRERNRCGTDVACIREVYDDYIDDLLFDLEEYE